MEEKRVITRSAGVLVSATLLSRVFGLLRDIVTARAFGTSLAMDAFVVAFTIPNLFRNLLGEGAMSAGFIPVFTRTLEKEGREKAWELANVVGSVLTLVLAGIIILGLAILQAGQGLLAGNEKFKLVAELLEIMLPYLFFICLLGLAMGILNSLRHFSTPALAPVIMNSVWILAVIFLCPRFGTRLEDRVFGLAWGILISGLIQLAVQVPVLVKKGFRFRFRLRFEHPGVRRVIALMGPAVLGLAFIQLNVIVDRLMAMAIGAGAPSALYYANRLVQFPLGVFGIALATAALPVMASQAAREDMSEFKRTFSYALRLIFLIAVPSALGLLILRRPIVALIFERREFTASSTAATAWAVLFYCFGLTAFCGLRIVTQAYYAVHDTRTPVTVGFLSMLLNFGMNLLVILQPWLRSNLREGGLALATSISATFNALALIYLLRKKLGPIGGREIAASLARVATASVVMGAACYGCLRWLTVCRPSGGGLSRLIAVAVPIAAGLLVFWLMTLVLGIGEVGELLQSFRRRSLPSEGPVKP